MSVPTEDVTSDAHDVPKMVGVYKKLFVILVVITLLGIGVAFIRLPIWLAVSVALAIIMFKWAVVLDAFKSLLVGRWILLMTLGLTVFFFAGLVLLPLWNREGHISETVDLSREVQMQKDKEPPVEGEHKADGKAVEIAPNGH